MAQALDELISGLNAVYQPQKDLVQSQLTALPAYYQAQQAGLDQTKTNAFNSITSGANSRGVLYSGVPIDEQAKYVGGTYLPAVANLQKDQTDKTFALQDSLNKINTQQYSQAYDTRNAQLKAEQDAQAKIQAAQITASSRTGRAPSAAENLQAFNQDLIGALQYAKSNPSKVGPGYREQVANQLAQQHGISLPDVNKAVGQVFPNGWEWTNGIYNSVNKYGGNV